MPFQSFLGRAGPNLTNDLPAQYMQQRAPELHAAYGDSDSQYNPGTRSHVLSNELQIIRLSDRDELQKLASQETESFVAMLDEFSRHRKPPTSLDSFNIRDRHSWVEVIDQLTLARARYDDKARGNRGMATKAVRYITDHARVVDPWLQLIPDTDYSSVVCGGLKFIFGAAVEYSKVRKIIMNVIDNLPDDINEVSNCLGRFSGAVGPELWAGLQEKALQLYLVILAMVEGMLRWLDENAFKKLIKAVALQKIYGTNIQTCVDEVNKRSARLRQAAVECAQSIGVENLQIDKRTHNMVQEMHTQGGQVVRDVVHMSKDIAALKAKAGTLAVLQDDNERMQGQISEIRSFAEQSDWNQGKILERIEAMQRNLDLMRFYQALSDRRALEPSGQAVMQQSELSRLSQKDIQAILAIDRQELNSVLDTVLSTGSREGFGSLELTRRLLEIREFRDWLQRDSSQAILLRSADELENITRFSHFSAALIGSLQDVDFVVTIHYFCGVIPWEEQNGRYHLLRYLTAQLLELWPWGPTLPIDSDLDRLMNYEFEPLCQLFSTAMESQLDATVFCIIDGSIRYREEDDLQQTVQWLLQLQSSLPRTIRLKLLLTWPAPSELLPLFDEEHQVHLSTSTYDRLGLDDGQGVRDIMRHTLERGRSRSPLPQRLIGYTDTEAQDLWEDD